MFKKYSLKINFMNHSNLALLFYLLSFLFTCRLRWWQYLLNITYHGRNSVENVPYYSVVILKKKSSILLYYQIKNDRIIAYC